MSIKLLNTRRVDGQCKSNAECSTQITSTRDISSIMADYTGVGIKDFKNFLNRCSRGPDIEEPEAAANCAILKEYLEAKFRCVGKEQDTGMELGLFDDFQKIWGYANKNNSMLLLSLVPSLMENLIRLCSYREEFINYGTALVKNLLQPSSLRIIYRGLTSSKEQIVSPCLRMLTEMNQFNSGALCGYVHSTFDFTIKDLPRNLEVKNSVMVAVKEDSSRPSVRFLFIRFFLSFLQHGEPSIRNSMLRLRSWITPLFKYLKTDTPSIIYDLLECITTKVLAEKEIPRATKTIVLNEWVLSNILGLYTRDETVHFSISGKQVEQRLADIAHEFLLSACTNRGSGICFPDCGWYPPGYSENGDKRRSAPKVYNRILSSFVTSIRPFAGTSQLKLMLEIFRSSPELVADHFLSNPSFNFEPKLTSTWIGYCTFLISIIALPIPRNFGTPGTVALPPPSNVVVENILPKPLGKTVMTKCLTHKNSLIRFLSIRLLITAFEKFRSVLDALETVFASLHDLTEAWKKCKSEIVEDFCKRIPDISVVPSCVSRIGANDLQTEMKTRLLEKYYAAIPEMASGKFDVNIAFTPFQGGEGDHRSGIGLLEMGHLLKIANGVPDVRWWNKTAAMNHSPFVAIVKLCCKSSITASQQRVRALLHSFASSSFLFQSETIVSPLDALLESLSAVNDPENLEAILLFLDDVVARCIRGPFKYLDYYAEAIVEIREQTPEVSGLPPVSPIIMTLVERWKFFMRSKIYSSQQKLCVVTWLYRFLEFCTHLGENKFVISILVDRLTTDSGAILEGFAELNDSMWKDQRPGLASKNIYDALGLVGIRDLFVALPSWRVDPHIVTLLSKYVLNDRIESSIFDLAMVQRAMVEIVKSKKIGIAQATTAVVELNRLMKCVAFNLISQGAQVRENIKLFVSEEGSYLDLFCSTSVSIDRIYLVVEISRGYAELFSIIFKKNDAILDSTRERLSSSLLKFVDILQALSEDEKVKLLFVYRSMITFLFTSEDINNLVARLCSEPSCFRHRIFPQLLVFILHLSVERGDVVDVKSINHLLKPENITAPVSAALVAYVSGTKAEHLQGIDCPVATTSEQVAVVCSLIPKLTTIRDAALYRLDEEIRAGHASLMLSERILALLEAYSVAVEASAEFRWASHTNYTTKVKLQNAFDISQNLLLQAVPNTSQVNVLRRAVSLFPSWNHKKFLKHITTNTKRGALTDHTVTLVATLFEKSGDAFTSEMKGWYLMVFNYLTRRFAEDVVLSDKVTAISMAFGKLLAQKKVKLENTIPRTTVNAVVEAGMLKHINVSQVVFFVVNVVSLSHKSLDVAKLLQLVLGHPENPLSYRGTVTEAGEIHHYIACLISKLFEVGTASLCSIATLDGILVLYRGTNDPIDYMLLNVIRYIEGHISRSCASRISLWSVLESTDKPFISRVRGRLEVSVNAKILARSTVPNKSTTKLDYLDASIGSIEENTIPLGKAYDPMFMLPALAFCLFSKPRIIEVQVAIDRHCIAYAMACLSSEDKIIRQMATGFLSTVVSKLEDLNHRGKTQLGHLILSVLASLSSHNAQTVDQPLPSAMGIFLAQTSEVLVTPTHFLYGKVMGQLLCHPLLQLHDLPMMLGIVQVDEEHHKEVAWILNILNQGLKTGLDLALYRKRNIFGNILSLCTSPNCTERANVKVAELLWNVPAIEGGATTLMTRNGAVAWIEQQVGVSKQHDLALKRLVARLFEGSAKKHVIEWSRGSLMTHFTCEQMKLKVHM
ncbi:ribosome 60S biogenesis N-terminal-domain-containing protein [Trichophaea hybrida]|nr:ribosome 60S biogenesis N-terminal-domain-containing protein [Trichophaea hybrida]